MFKFEKSALSVNSLSSLFIFGKLPRPSPHIRQWRPVSFSIFEEGALCHFFYVYWGEWALPHSAYLANHVYLMRGGCAQSPSVYIVSDLNLILHIWQVRVSFCASVSVFLANALRLILCIWQVRSVSSVDLANFAVKCKQTRKKRFFSRAYNLTFSRNKYSKTDPKSTRNKFVNVFAGQKHRFRTLYDYARRLFRIWLLDEFEGKFEIALGMN
jgi:hypothetical protein